MFGTDIGIDLGTANILVFVRGKGVIIREPSVVAIDADTNKIRAIGEEARRMVGRTPGSIRAIRPLNQGVIADYNITEEILRYFIGKAVGRRRLFRPRVVICVPSGVTSVEKRAVLEAATQAAAKEVYLISEPMAAAIGCGMDVAKPHGNMVVDIGGGTTDIAVISLGGEVVSQSLRIGGDDFEEAIIRHVKRVHNIAIGERTAEEIKIQIGSANPASDRTMGVRGRDLVSGLPCTITLHGSDVHQSLEESIRSIVEAIKGVLEITPPELAADIFDQGIMLTGGGAMLDSLPELLARETEVPVHLADDPLSCVARGTGEVLDALDSLRDGVVMTTRNMR